MVEIKRYKSGVSGLPRKPDKKKLEKARRLLSPDKWPTLDLWIRYYDYQCIESGMMRGQAHYEVFARMIRAGWEFVGYLEDEYLAYALPKGLEPI